MSKLTAGNKAPMFEGVNQNGRKISLNDFKGKKLILYFYPKDNTPGCTAEACNLNDNYEMWINKGYEVVGVSPDNEKSHLKFIDKFGLKFNLIADTENKILEAYNAWGEKSMYGKKYMGIERATFLIDKKGMINQIWRKVKVGGHVDEVLAAVQKIG